MTDRTGTGEEGTGAATWSNRVPDSWLADVAECIQSASQHITELAKQLAEAALGHDWDESEGTMLEVSMTDHTPGPWVAKRENNRYTVGTWIEQSGYEGFGTITAIVPSASAAGEADAKLIAAAPDLLAACCAGDTIAPGPKLLEIAAELLAENGREHLAACLRAKADAERLAIAKACGQE